MIHSQMNKQAKVDCRVAFLFALADSSESRLAKATVLVERTILARAIRGVLSQVKQHGELV